MSEIIESAATSSLTTGQATSSEIELSVPCSETDEQAALVVFEAIGGDVCNERGLEMVRTKVSNNPGLWKCKNKQRRYPVEAAVIAGKLDILAILLDAKPDYSAGFVIHLIHLAYKNDQPECDELLKLWDKQREWEESNRRYNDELIEVGRQAKALADAKALDEAKALVESEAQRESRGQQSQKMSRTVSSVEMAHITLMLFCATGAFGLLIGFSSIYPPLHGQHVKIVHLSYYELLTFPTTTDGFVLLTANTACFLSSMKQIFDASWPISRQWTTGGYSLVAVFSFTICYFALLNKLVLNSITIGGGHVEIPGALIVVSYSILVILLMILLYKVQKVICGAFDKFKRLDLESDGELPAPTN